MPDLETETVDALARRVRDGDILAKTALAKRLLTGDRAPRLPHDGAGLLVEAANAGDAEAPARLAVLAASGAFVQQNWANALQLLAVAAERGWKPAQEQVLALSPDAAASVSGSADWRRLGAAIDIRTWTAAPDGVTLHAVPLVRRVPGLVPDAVCAWFIRQSRGRLVRARVYDAKRGQDTVNETRTNTTATFTLNDVELIHMLLQARMAAACGIPLQNMEAPAVLHYDPGEQITDHYDFVDPASATYATEIAARGQRPVTFLAYLNDDYEGGETVFPRLGVSCKGRRGEGLYFVNIDAEGAPDLRMVHAGRPPAGGEKWIVSQFIRSRQMLGGGNS